MKSCTNFENGSCWVKNKVRRSDLRKLFVGSSGLIFSLIIMKFGQNVCLDEISDEFEIESCQNKNYVNRSNLRKKTLCTLLGSHFRFDSHEPWSECYS